MKLQLFQDPQSQSRQKHKNQTHIYTNNKFSKKQSIRYRPCFKKKKKKHIRLGHTGIVDPSVDLSIPESES